MYCRHNVVSFLLFSSFRLFLVCLGIFLDDFQWVLMRTLAEGLGSYISEFLRGCHVMDRDPSFLNQLFKKEESQGDVSRA